MAREGATDRRSAAKTHWLYLGLFGNLQCIVNFNPQVPHSAFQLRVAQQRLHCPQVFGSPVNQSSLGSAHRMCAIGGGIKTNSGDPSMNDPGVLPVEICGEFCSRLGNKYCSDFRLALAIHAATAFPVSSVSSNCTGLCVFRWMTIARANIWLP